MTDYYKECRWFLRHGPETRYVEVTRDEWLQAEYDAGFRGGRMIRPSTGAWTNGRAAGVIVYPHEAVPEGAVELEAEPPTITYEWATRIWAHDGYDQEDMPSFANDHMTEEGRARDRARRINEKVGRVITTPIRRRIETYGWEEVPSE